MDDEDLELQPAGAQLDPGAPASTRAAALWLAAALLIGVAGGAGTFLMLQARRAPPAAPSVSAAPAPAKPAAPALPSLGGEPQAVDVPPLDQSDPVVRQLVQRLSRNPAVTAWLTTDGLIRNFAVVVTSIAGGATPAKFLAPLRPATGFRVIDRADGGTRLDPVSYDRYTTLGTAVASIDPEGAARLYATLKPRIEAAYHDLGYPGSFDRALEQAIDALLSTPVVDGDVALKHKGIGYAYVDDRLESLTAAQKQYLRMGPRNIRMIDLHLRAIARVLGIPNASLPPQADH